MSEYIITMDLTFRSTVTVEADSEAQALGRAKDWEVIDDGMHGAELTDWRTVSPARKVLDLTLPEPAHQQGGK